MHQRFTGLATADETTRTTPSPSALLRASLLITAIVLTGCHTSETEIEAVREAARIADQSRHEQAEQTRTFAELEATLSKERQSIDQERAQAAERHDQAAQSRERAIQAQRQINEAAARDKFLGQAMIVCMPLLMVALALWGALRLAGLCFTGSRDADSAIVEVLLLESHLKTTMYDPTLPARLIAESRRGLPHEPPEESGGEPDDSAPEDEDETDPDAKSPL